MSTYRKDDITLQLHFPKSYLNTVRVQILKKSMLIRVNVWRTDYHLSWHFRIFNISSIIFRWNILLFVNERQSRKFIFLRDDLFHSSLEILQNIDDSNQSWFSIFQLKFIIKLDYDYIYLKGNVSLIVNEKKRINLKFLFGAILILLLFF